MEDEGFDLARFWMEGGASMYLVALMWVAAEAAGTFAIITRKQVVALAAIAISVMPLTVGVLGTVYNRSVVQRAVEAVNPLQRDVILTQGMHEAMRPLQLGGVLTLFCFPLGVIAFWLAPKDRSKKVASITDPVE
jgi:hypothetical protein